MRKTLASTALAIALLAGGSQAAQADDLPPTTSEVTDAPPSTGSVADWAKCVWDSMWLAGDLRGTLATDAEIKDYFDKKVAQCTAKHL